MNSIQLVHYNVTIYYGYVKRQKTSNGTLLTISSLEAGHVLSCSNEPICEFGSPPESSGTWHPCPEISNLVLATYFSA